MPKKSPKRAGRPKKSAARRRTHRLEIRLTKDEWEWLRKAADGDISPWARGVLLQNTNFGKESGANPSGDSS